MAVTHKLLSDLEYQTAFGIGDLRPCYCGRILGRLQTMLAFSTSFKEVTNANIELLVLVEIVEGEIARVEKGIELAVSA